MFKNIIIWFEKHNKISWLITILIAGFIFYMSSKTFSPSFQNFFSIKSYIYHFAVFFALAFFILISSVKGNLKTYNKLFFLVFIIAVLYAASDELHQYFVPGRSCDLNDFITDCLGISLSFIFYNYRLNKK